MQRRTFFATAAAAVASTSLTLPRSHATADKYESLEFVVVTDTHLGYKDQDAALQLWNKTAAAIAKSPGKFVLHLGDMIDRDVHSYQNVVPVYRRLKMPHYQVIGNHDYTIDDAAKAGVPGLLEMEHRYYSVTAGRWRFVILDGNEVSLFSHAKTSLETAAAARYARASTRKLTEWSGGIGQDQLAWLRVQLDQAREAPVGVVP